MLPIGITCFNVREILAGDFMNVMKALKDMGLDCVEVMQGLIFPEFKPEPAGTFWGVDYTDYVKACKEYDISVVSTFNQWLGWESFKKTLEASKAMGAKDIIVSLDFVTEDETHKAAETANEIGKVCREEGLTFCYHNHFHEWRKFGDKYIMDVFLDETDPDLVGIEFDTYWGLRGGADPLEWLDKMGKRVKIIHQKDLGKNTKNVNLVPLTMNETNFHQVVMGLPPTDFAEVGTGCMPVEAIVRKGYDLGVDAIIIEQDFTLLPPLESAEISLRNLRRIVDSIQ